MNRNWEPNVTILKSPRVVYSKNSKAEYISHSRVYFIINGHQDEYNILNKIQIFRQPISYKYGRSWEFTHFPTRNYHQIVLRDQDNYETNCNFILDAYDYKIL